MKTHISLTKSLKAMATLVIGASLLFSTGAPASGQILNNIARRAKNAAETKIMMGADRAVHNTLDKAEKSVEKGVKNAAGNSSAKKSKSSAASVPEGRSGGSKVKGSGTTWYVSTNGSNKNDGQSPETPLKNVQKALDEASDGDLICVAEGNYTGTLDQGFIEITKYVSLVGGYNEDFSERDPYSYKTYIQTNPSHVSKNGTKASINLEVTGSRNKVVMVDGFSVDRGEQALYCAPSDDPVAGWPEGCLTGRKLMPGDSPSVKTVGGAAQERQCVTGHVEGHLIIRNCVFANAVYFGIQLMSKGGDWEVYNNVFVANNYSSCRIDSMTRDANECYVDFHHNTVLFSWCRDKYMEDMGYGFEFMTLISADVHHNLFVGNNYAAVARTHALSGPDAPIEAKRITNLYDNYYFLNAADLQLPSKGGGKWTNIKCTDIEDMVDEKTLPKAENNLELPAGDAVINAFDKDYLEAFANLKVISQSSNFNPNSASNQFRQAMGMNMQGSETRRVSMYGNRYNFDKALKLFGAKANYGAQKP